MVEEEFNRGTEAIERSPTEGRGSELRIQGIWVGAIFEEFKDRVGDFDSEEGKKFLTERSPLTYIEQVSVPVMVSACPGLTRCQTSSSRTPSHIITLVGQRDGRVPAGGHQLQPLGRFLLQRRCRERRGRILDALAALDFRDDERQAVDRAGVGSRF